MKNLHKLLFLLSLALLFVACDKDGDSPAWASLQGLKGKWAPVSSSWTADRYLEFDKGNLSTYELYSDHVFKDGVIFNWWGDSGDHPLSSVPYYIQNGRLYAGRTDLGTCSIQGDSLKIGNQQYLRVKNMVPDCYTRFNFGPEIDPVKPVIKTGKAGKTIKIPCTLEKPVPFEYPFYIIAFTDRVDKIRIYDGLNPVIRDTLSLHIDENTTENTILDSIAIDHPATGLVIIKFVQYPVWPSTIEVENVPAGGIAIGAEGDLDFSIFYNIISPAKSSDKCSYTFNPDPTGSWVKVNSQSNRQINLAIFRNVDTATRETNLVLTYPDSREVIIPIRQQGQLN
ncbi:MAG: hypothetical protein J6Y32_06795 [Bacteroidales bacterium]|nr:hypothetical protein [Bacteroidales bacterium]